jgi:hypothetical protein
MMSRIHRRTVVLAALVSFGGCGGALTPPTGGSGMLGGAGGSLGGAGGSGGLGGSRVTGGGGSITISDAGRDVVDCFEAPQVPAQPVAGTPCRFAIPIPPCPYLDSAHIGVAVNGSGIPRDTSHVNGWDYTDATFTQIDIYGPTCDALTSGAAATVNIVFLILI